MKLYKLSGIFTCLLGVAALTGCDDDTTTIGSVISTGQVSITVDTLKDQQLNGKAVAIETFDSKTGNLMIGSIQREKYGKLSCSFVTKLMCAANLEIPDSLFRLADFVDRVDSCKLILGAERKDIVGDSLAPQKLTVFQLTELLPSDINNSFNPSGYYNPRDPLASRSYTVSEIANTDSAFYNNSYVDISVDLPVEYGREIITKYKEDPTIFEWPQTMANQSSFKGYYVEPTFGNGCVANIHSVFVAVFYHSLATTTKEDEDGNTTTTETHVNHMAVPFTVSPEVLSSNNISYTPSSYIEAKNNSSTNDGEVVVTTPGGYLAEFQFPAQSLMDQYLNENTHLTTVNELLLFIPAEPFDEDSGIGIADNLLLIKKSEYEDFFNNNKTPDNKTSFTGVYDSSNGRYFFTTMRDYFLNLLEKDTITEEDYTFMLVPVEITTETESNYYGSGSTYVTKCVPYTKKPTMTLLKTNEAIINFSYSTQVIK